MSRLIYQKLLEFVFSKFFLGQKCLNLLNQQKVFSKVPFHIVPVVVVQVGGVSTSQTTKEEVRQGFSTNECRLVEWDQAPNRKRTTSSMWDDFKPVEMKVDDVWVYSSFVGCNDCVTEYNKEERELSNFFFVSCFFLFGKPKKGIIQAIQSTRWHATSQRNFLSLFTNFFSVYFLQSNKFTTWKDEIWRKGFCF